ncbi:MAG: hypothetical protein ACLTG4_03445 [Oscillospiraceae bacterium]
MNARFNAEGDYALYPIYVLRGRGMADGRQRCRASKCSCPRSRMK